MHSLLSSLLQPRALAASLLAIHLQLATAAPATLTVQVDRPDPRISPTLYGIFFEEINCAGDGGIYAELIRNRSFEDADKPEHWSLVSSTPARAEWTIDNARPMSDKNPRSLKLTVGGLDGGRAGIANDGYWGVPLVAGETYLLSLNARTDAGPNASLQISLESRTGQAYARKKITGLGSDWKSFKVSLRPNASDTESRLVICAGTPGTFWFDMVSLFPRKTWKGRPNGLRPDLAEKLNGLKPAFLRFPGGCWVEGDTINLAYRWKQTIGDLGDRRNQYNIWQYYSTHGLGYHEYLQMCEDLKAEPLFVVNVGMSHKENVPMNELGPWVQDALDAIQYANGPVSSQWGALRAKHGHPAPFNLRYMEIGNENGGPPYHERYAVFYKAIKAKYPDMNLIADEWNGVPKNAPVEIIDEHYYNTPSFFVQNATRYDHYSRTGPKVYVGEYAVTQNCGQGNLRGALGEAAFMTGMERNSDVVIMSSYAPLFANVHYKKWNPDLINFDNARVYGTPSYYVQKLFAENRGDIVLPTRVSVADLPQEPSRGAIGLGTWETQSEYKDIKVTQGDKVLYAWDGSQGTNGWRVYGGDWQAKEGVLQQVAKGDNRRMVVGDPAWSDYTLTLKARKLSGAEGFLILFHVKDENNWLWWNLGGWNNSRHAIEQGADGGKATLGRDVPGQIETGRWYDIRIELAGTQIRCYLDGKLIHDVRETHSLTPLHIVASRVDKTGDIILKTVNVSKTALDTAIRFEGASKVRCSAPALLLTSADGADENTLDQPTKVAPVTMPAPDAAPEFLYTFPANSLTVLRLRAK